MILLPIRTELLTEASVLSSALCAQSALQEGDILVLSAKACAVTEGCTVDFAHVSASPEATMWAERCGKSAAFRQVVLNETERMHGTVIGSCPQAMLCELRPEGLSEGTILAVNAGVDSSNTTEGTAIGWPHDPVASARRVQQEVREQTGKTIAVIISDSCCRPRRLGVTAIALVACGVDPLQNQVGREDLFGRELTMTHEAVADQLATAANFLMGNANQSIPAVLVREHGLPFTDFCGWVPGIEREQDLFRGLF